MYKENTGLCFKYANTFSTFTVTHWWSVVKNQYVLKSSLVTLRSLDHNCSSGILNSTVFLTHWGRVTHICVSKQTIIGTDNGLSPGRRQAIIWTNDGILLIGTFGTNFSEIVIETGIFLFKKMGLKASSAKWRPFCLGLNVLNDYKI